MFLHQQSNQDNVPRTHATVFGESYAGTTVGTDLQRDYERASMEQRAHGRASAVWVVVRAVLSLPGLSPLEEAEKVGLTPNRIGKKVKRIASHVRDAMAKAVEDGE